MQRRKTFQIALLYFALTIAFNLALSALSFAHDKRSREAHGNKKWEKFVNGHDARDGRRDGRGPRFRRASWRRNEWRERHFREARLRHHRRLRHRRF